ncbi:hypothetical protein [Rhodoblastus sp.]|uniref:hypothetical protein n=1 Tax=Rhodoblastus sp. TaxID=1962975 RepID=UPI00261CD91D|nr:hypothetical protein [Rhodoblastus sp.]
MQNDQHAAGQFAMQRLARFGPPPLEVHARRVTAANRQMDPVHAPLSRFGFQILNTQQVKFIGFEKRDERRRVLRPDRVEIGSQPSILRPDAAQGVGIADPRADGHSDFAGAIWRTDAINRQKRALAGSHRRLIPWSIPSLRNPCAIANSCELRFWPVGAFVSHARAGPEQIYGAASNAGATKPEDENSPRLSGRQFRLYPNEVGRRFIGEV